MNYYDALERAARASGVSFNEIGIKLGHASNYIHNAKSRGSSPTVDNAARAVEACGYVLALVPADEVSDGAIVIDPPSREGGAMNTTDRCKLTFAVARALSGENVIVYVRDQVAARSLFDEAWAIVEAECGKTPGISAKYRTSSCDIRFGNGGEIRFVYRSQIRGMSCDVFVFDECSSVPEDVAPVALLAKERFVLDK